MESCFRLGTALDGSVLTANLHGALSIRPGAFIRGFNRCIRLRFSRMKEKRSPKIFLGSQPQLTRLHGLVQRIQRGDYPNAKMMAEEYEKSWRTIIRDLDFIRDVWRMPLAYDPYRYGFYFSEPIGKFPMVPISERELVSVFVAQKVLHQYHGTPFERPLKSAFSKLASSLEGELSVAWADLDAAISFRGVESEVSNLLVLQELGEAIRRRQEVSFEYQKLGELSGETRRVQPYHLACVANQWYLFAYDLMRRAIRKFVPARMKNLVLSKTHFERPKRFSIDKLLKGSFGVFSGDKPVRMRVWFGRSRAQLMRERKWHKSQKIKELNHGEIELSFELSSTVELVPWILSWGEHARAIAPKSLVNEVKQTARRIAELYK
jgi:predicted DNA-binding transcriptional regulator YafY